MDTLYEMSTEFHRLYEIASTDEDPQALVDTIEGMMTAVEEKAEGYAMVMKQLEMEAKQADEEIKYWRTKKEARENNIRRMKTALMQAMGMMEVSELKAGKYTFKIHKNGGKAPLKIIGEVPDNMTKVSVEPDNDKIRSYLEGQPGQSCDWAVLMDRGTHLAIK